MASKNGIYRVVLIYHPENFLSAVDAYRDALGITDFEGPYQIHQMGFRAVVSWDAGIEIISPLSQGGFSEYLRDILKSKGEGIFSVVYQVKDLESAEQQAATHGYPRMGDYIDGLKVREEWCERFTMLKEASLSPIAGVAVTLIQIETTNGEQVS